jgi:NADH-quinone oxidoreductase subunit M
MGPWFAVVAGVGLILGAMYLLLLLGKIVWGPLKVPGGHDDPHEHAHGDKGHGGLPRDLSFREIAILAPIAVACLAIGVYPKPLLDATEPSAAAALVSFPEKVNAFNAAHGRVAAPKVALNAQEATR